MRTLAAYVVFLVGLFGPLVVLVAVVLVNGFAWSDHDPLDVEVLSGPSLWDYLAGITVFVAMPFGTIILALIISGAARSNRHGTR